MKIKSKITGKIYAGGVIGYSIRDGKGIVWIDDRVLVTYSKVKDLDTLKRLFREDYKVTSIPKKPENINWEEVN